MRLVRKYRAVLGDLIEAASRYAPGNLISMRRTTLSAIEEQLLRWKIQFSCPSFENARYSLDIDLSFTDGYSESDEIALFNVQVPSVQVLE